MGFFQGLFDTVRLIDATLSPPLSTDYQDEDVTYYEEATCDCAYWAGCLPGKPNRVQPEAIAGCEYCNYGGDWAHLRYDWCPKHGGNCYHGTRCWFRHTDDEVGEHQPWTYKVRIIILDAFCNDPVPTPRHVERAIMEKVRKYQNCCYCAHYFDSGEVKIVEHCYCLANGGSNQRRNLRASCKPCNDVKRANTFGWTRRPITRREWEGYNQDVRIGVLRLRGLL